MDMSVTLAKKIFFFSKNNNYFFFTKKGIHNEIKVEFIILLFRRKYREKKNETFLHY